MSVGRGSSCCRRLSPGCRCLSLGRSSVSHRRSSNRTCGSPASGSRTGFTAGHARENATIGSFAAKTLHFPLGTVVKLLPEVLDKLGSSLSAMPIFAPFQSMPEPGLRPRCRAPQAHLRTGASSPWQKSFWRKSCTDSKGVTDAKKLSRTLLPRAASPGRSHPKGALRTPAKAGSRCPRRDGGRARC